MGSNTDYCECEWKSTSTVGTSPSRKQQIAHFGQSPLWICKDHGSKPSNPQWQETRTCLMKCCSFSDNFCQSAISCARSISCSARSRWYTKKNRKSRFTFGFAWNFTDPIYKYIQYIYIYIILYIIFIVYIYIYKWYVHLDLQTGTSFWLFWKFDTLFVKWADLRRNWPDDPPCQIYWFLVMTGHSSPQSCFLVLTDDNSDGDCDSVSFCWTSCQISSGVMVFIFYTNRCR